jgi:hypothetical protein
LSSSGGRQHNSACTHKKFPLFIKISHLFITAKGSHLDAALQKHRLFEKRKKMAFFLPAQMEVKSAPIVPRLQLDEEKIQTFATLVSRLGHGENEINCRVQRTKPASAYNVCAPRVQAPRNVFAFRGLNGVNSKYFSADTKTETFMIFHRWTNSMFALSVKFFLLCTLHFGWKLMMCHLKMALGSTFGGLRNSSTSNSAVCVCVRLCMFVRNDRRETFSYRLLGLTLAT